MSNFFNIHKALIDGFKALNLPYPLSEPNRELKDSEKGDSAWLKVSILDAPTNVATLGLSGTDNNPGIMQIDVNVPQNEGSGLQLQIVDTICSNFPTGKSLQYSGQAVKITNSSISGIRNVGGFARRSVSISYYARTKRVN